MEYTFQVKIVNTKDPYDPYDTKEVDLNEFFDKMYCSRDDFKVVFMIC